jgi:hypothetical protein
MYSQRQVHTAWTQWLAIDEWDVFATLNFDSLSMIQGNKADAAGKIWRSCLGTLDRAIYGSTHKNQPRFNRIAFKHVGANGCNPHVHILAKSPINIEDFCIAWNAIWATQFSAAARPASNSIAPLISMTGAIGYGQHEEFKNDTGSFDERLSYINTGTTHLVRTDAVSRLHAKASRTNLIKAHLAFPQHIQATQANHERRERLRVAALQRT